MRTYLVTGAAGFIGANYLKYMLKKYDDVRIVVLDLLTYAGYLGTIADDIDNERCFFVKGDEKANPHKALKMGSYVSSAVVVVASGIVIWSKRRKICTK